MATGIPRLISKTREKAVGKTEYTGPCFKRGFGLSGGNLCHVAPKTLNRQFELDEPSVALVTDFTYIRTHEG